MYSIKKKNRKKFTCRAFIGWFTFVEKNKTDPCWDPETTQIGPFSAFIDSGQKLA
jgi:hypothetical protein